MKRFFHRCSVFAVIAFAVAAHLGAIAGIHGDKNATLAASPAPAPLAPPSNDDCSGAIVFPPIVQANTVFLTAPVDITDATPQGTDEGLHPCSQGGGDRTIWYSFTPAITGTYVISTCASTATGDTIYDTVISVFDSTGGACPQSGSPLACDDSFPCSGTVPGAPYIDQGTVSMTLTAGHAYFVVPGHWAPDSGGVFGSFTSMVVSFVLQPFPRNDDCRVSGGGYAAGGQGPAPLTLDRITYGTTAHGADDYSAAGCPFLAPGGLPTPARGADVVFSFTPPDSGAYSFKYVSDNPNTDLRSQSPVLYLSTQCPDPNPAVGVPGCLAAANRMNDSTTGNLNRAEELDCVSLTGGTPYYLYFDDANAGNAGGELAVETTRCDREVEPNDTIATATAWAPNAGCFMEGDATPSGASGGDVDFYALGAPPAGSKLFALVDSEAANNSDFEMRFTNATDTLAYDDNDGTSWVGLNSPIIAGPFAPGGAIYARINGKPTLPGLGPYRLYYHVETGTPEHAAQPDPNPDGLGDDTLLEANHVTQGGFIAGTIYAVDETAVDADCWRFVAHEGDNILAFVDHNPTRSPGTVTNLWPHFYANDLWQGLYTGQVVRNRHPNTPQLGTLQGNEATGAPSVVSEAFQFRARYTGAYTVCFEPTVDAGGHYTPDSSAYPLPYQGSISVNCGPAPPPDAADVAVTEIGPSSPVHGGDSIDFTITVTNLDASGVAQDIRVIDHLPAQFTFSSVTIDDGFSHGVQCRAVPLAGDAGATIDCTSFSLAPGASATYTVSARLEDCLAAQVIRNDVAISTYTHDANAANDAAHANFTIDYTGQCSPVICRPGSGCYADTCQLDAACTGPGGMCQGTPRNCADANACTLDTCDPLGGPDPCIHDSSQSGDLCYDGNDCTHDACDPVSFCIFPPMPAGLACNDSQNCTTGDLCDGNGSCIGHNVCDDGLPCTDDFADEGNNCACENDVSFPGSLCEDGNACTTGTTCDGIGGDASHCVDPTGTTNCEDNNPCTDDSCDPALGCVHTSAAPPETQNVTVAADKATFSWPAVTGATRYDVLRGSTSAFPVGPGGADEFCFDDLAAPSVTDAAVPASGTGFWYLSRGENACGSGSYGTRTNGTQRTSTTCP